MNRILIIPLDHQHDISWTCHASPPSATMANQSLLKTGFRNASHVEVSSKMGRGRVKVFSLGHTPSSVKK